MPNLDSVLEIKDPQKQMEALLNTVGILIKNLSELNGYLTSKNIKAKSIVADRLDVNELSAITADLGHITAGLIEAVTIIASTFRTSNSYPRAEINPATNQFIGYYDPDTYVAINPADGGALQIRDGGSSLDISMFGGVTFLETSGQLTIQTGGSTPIVFNVGQVRVPSWTSVYNMTSMTDLNSTLVGKADRSSVFGTVYVASTAGGPADTPITFNSGVRIS